MRNPTDTPRRRVRLGRLITVSLLAVALASVLAAPALASPSEEQQGAQTLNAIHAGKLKASGLSSSQYERVGEYLMGQALGSPQLHERMNSLMNQMMGSSASDQMHIYLGERYLGKSVQPTGKNAPLYGLMGVMMSGHRGSSLAGMMSHYLGGPAQGTAPNTTIGPGMMGYNGTQPATRSSGSWPTAAIVVTAVLGALVLIGMLALGVPMLRRRAAHRQSSGPASTPAG